jgi:hypothetical protein
MKLHVAVGSKMTREAWQVVSYKLLDLVGASMKPHARVHVQDFIKLAGRAWSDLEQRAAGENPNAVPPGAPIDESEA